VVVVAVVLAAAQVVPAESYGPPPEGFSGIWVMETGDCGSWYTTMVFTDTSKDKTGKALPVTQFQLRIVPVGYPQVPAQFFETTAGAPIDGSNTPPVVPVEVRPYNTTVKQQAPGWTGGSAVDPTTGLVETAWISGPVLAPYTVGTPNSFILDLVFKQGTQGAASPCYLEVQAYDGTQLVGNETAYYNGTKWSNLSVTEYPHWEASSPIPEPLTMLGVFAGISGVGAYLRHRRMSLP